MKLRQRIAILAGGAAGFWICAAIAEEPAEIFEADAAAESAEVSGSETVVERIEGAEMTGMDDEPRVIVCWSPPPPQHDWTVELWDDIYGIAGHHWGTEFVFAGNAYRTQMRFEVVAGGSGAVIGLMFLGLASLSYGRKGRREGASKHDGVPR